MIFEGFFDAEGASYAHCQERLVNAPRGGFLLAVVLGVSSLAYGGLLDTEVTYGAKKGQQISGKRDACICTIGLSEDMGFSRLVLTILS